MDGFHLPNDTLDERGVRSVKGAPETFAADAFVVAVRRLAAGDSEVDLPDFDRVVDEPRPGRIVVCARPIASSSSRGTTSCSTASRGSSCADLFGAVAHLDIDPVRRVERLVRRHVRFGKTHSEASAFVRSSDEPNAARVEAVRHRAHFLVDLD